MKIGMSFQNLFIPLVVLFGQCNIDSPDRDALQEVTYTLQKVYDLPYDLYESSGIIIFDSLLWTFNDSRNDAILYGLDLITGVIHKTLHLTNAENVDWEDITQDSKYIYIGDFGNNRGNRKDLCVYRISKQDIEANSNKQNISSDKINFYYQDQDSYISSFRSTPFDCEALLFDGESLILFSKDWVDQRSTLYKLPVLPGNYEAKRYYKMDSEGLITGAELDLQNKTLLLCGHNYNIPFVLKKDNFRSVAFLEFKMLRIDLNDFFGIKLEGIACFNNEIYLSSENSADIQALYHLVEQ
jgi:hypothetical protein